MCQGLPCVSTRVKLTRPFQGVPEGAIGTVEAEHLANRQVDVRFDLYGLQRGIPEDFLGTSSPFNPQTPVGTPTASSSSSG